MKINGVRWGSIWWRGEERAEKYSLVYTAVPFLALILDASQFLCRSYTLEKHSEGGKESGMFFFITEQKMF